MQEGRNPVAHPGGYFLVLLGAVAFVGSCFLPYYDLEVNAPPLLEVDPSLFRMFTSFRETALAGVGGVLTLFGGIATIVWISMIGLRGHRFWAPVALLAVTVAWSLTWIGTLMGGTMTMAPARVGYWGLLVSIGVVVAGTIVVWTSSRGTSPSALPPGEAVGATQSHAR
jgi:hypothetical protein